MEAVAAAGVAEVEAEVEAEDEGVEPKGAANTAVRQAEAEGLTLQKSNNTTGYLGVYHQKVYLSTKPFVAAVQRDGRKVHLGSFGTAEQATGLRQDARGAGAAGQLQA